jgi:hypothetical protein
MTIIEVNIDADNKNVIQDFFVKENVPFEAYVSRVVNFSLYEMKCMRRDMELFKEYVAKQPRNKQPLWYYGLKLRKSLGWTHSHLLDVEDNILGARIEDED